MLGKIVIVDKDIHFANKLKKVLSQYFINEEIEVFDQYPIIFLENNDIDLLFIDQDFDEYLLAADMMRKIKHSDMQIVVLANRDVLMYDAVSLFPVYDCRKEDLDWELKRILRRLKGTHFREEINTKNGTRIRVNRIVYIESTMRHTIYNLINGETIVDKINIRKCNADFSCFNFIRCNRRYLINPYFIGNEKDSVLTLKNRVQIKISKNYYPSFKKSLEEYILATT